MGRIEDKGSWGICYPDDPDDIAHALTLPGSWPGMGCYVNGPPSSAQQDAEDDTEGS
jgi:hypothetical protein